MTTKEAYDKARQLAQEGNYEAALQALIGYDHPKIEALRVQIREAIALKHGKSSATVAQPKAKNVDLAAAVAEGVKQADKAKQAEKSKQMGYGCLVLLAICGICWLFSLYVTQPKPAENLAKMCELVRSVNFQCDPEQIMRDYPQDVAWCQEVYGNFVDVDELKYTWQNCLRSRGVEFVPET